MNIQDGLKSQLDDKYKLISEKYSSLSPYKKIGVIIGALFFIYIISMLFSRSPAEKYMTGRWQCGPNVAWSFNGGKFTYKNFSGKLSNGKYKIFDENKDKIMLTLTGSDGVEDVIMIIQGANTAIIGDFICNRMG